MNKNISNISCSSLAFTVNLDSPADFRDNFFSRSDNRFFSVLDDARIDLLSISNFIYAADRRIPRSSAKDGWTREINMTIYVLLLEKWKVAQKVLEEMLSFLTGDNWTIIFKKREYSENEIKLRKMDFYMDDEGIGKNVCMFSGGLDSFIGAIDMLTSDNEFSPIFVSHYGGGSKGTKDYQQVLQTKLIEKFEKLSDCNFVSFYATAMKSLTELDEPTTRSRSFMFFSHAIALTHSGGQLIIPENGFVSLNVPLFESRNGSSSTRTTHPYYMNLFRKVLEFVGINISIVNPYQFLTKGEMVQQCLDPSFLNQNLANTMSCSHPEQARWSGFSEPIHCGYCLPCTIRRASILSSDIQDTTPYRYKKYENTVGRETLNALKIAIFENQHSNPISRVQYSGPLEVGSLKRYARVYSIGMCEIEKLINEV
ncbi:TPA: hypothetical protein IV340_002681 [Enterococcus faecium]|nr:hypothetical protein [Enterococcus faecium]